MTPIIGAALLARSHERVAELARTPRAPLTLRFGPEVGRRLDQALGRICALTDHLERDHDRTSFGYAISLRPGCPALKDYHS